MRIAIMSDIHGNIVALDAVLAAIEAEGGVDEHWILGDIVEAGPAPVAVLERIAALPRTRCIRGNTDRYVFVGGPIRFFAPGDPPAMNLEAAGAIAWTQGMVTAGGWLPWLEALPLEIRTVLPNGAQVLAVHAAPGRDAGLGIKVGLTEAELTLVLSKVEADLIFGGHHHRPLDTMVQGKRVVNVGSVSIPFPPDLRASYALLTADQRGYQVALRRVDYDREAVIAEVERLRHPGMGYIVNHLRGLRQSTGRDFIEQHLRELRQGAEDG
ncbi:MAG: metallophosphoesterase family protein [Caldilineaceae bacterium]